MNRVFVTLSAIALTLFSIAAVAAAFDPGAYAFITGLLTDPNVQTGLLAAEGASVIDPEMVKAELKKIGADINKFIAAQKERYGEIDQKHQELQARLLEVEQKQARVLNAVPAEGAGRDSVAELAELLVTSDQTKAFLGGNTPKTAISVPQRLIRAAITSPGGQNQPLVPSDRRTDIVTGPQRRLTIRDLFTQLPTDSNLVEFTRETAYTNNAGPQASNDSPPVFEGSLKNESSFAFTLAQAPVATIAHFVIASRQILADARMLERYLRDRLLYGLGLEEERELLYGDGSQGEMLGLVEQASDYAPVEANSPDTYIDVLGRSVAQLASVEYVNPTGIILNPLDWWNHVRLAKNANGDYIVGDPQIVAPPNLWGLPVVLTNSMTRGEFVTVDALRAGFIADREDANVRLSENVNDQFIRNLVTLLAEERTTLVIERPQAIVHGRFADAM